MLEVGIVGLPNVGKSTLFNALTQAQAETSNYPFCTIDANVAVAPVPDPRLDRVAEIFQQEKTVPVHIKFVDIAGLVRGASQGEGLGNQFLAHIRQVDAVLHLVRCFDSDTVSHVDGTVDAVRDVATIENELLLADAESLARRLEKARRQAKSGRDEDERAAEFIAQLQAWVEAGRPARDFPAREHAPEVFRDCFLLTAKPCCYVANAPESGGGPHVAALASWAAERGAAVVTIPVALMNELAELPADEAAIFLEEYGVEGDALSHIVAAAYRLLDQITFYTAVGREATAWNAPRGIHAAQAAGRIHSDMESGFIKAEIVPFEGLDAAGSWSAAREQGLVQIAGREHVVSDGDVLQIRFHPGGN